MEKILASGHKWKLTQEDDRVYLSLISEYGTVELLAKDLSVLRILESIAHTYDRLKEQGPIEANS